MADLAACFRVLNLDSSHLHMPDGCPVSLSRGLLRPPRLPEIHLGANGIMRCIRADFHHRFHDAVQSSVCCMAPTMSQTNCRPRKVHETVSVTINLLLDLLVVIAPIPLVWSLRINTSKKIAVSAKLSLGLIYKFPAPITFARSNLQGVIVIMLWRLTTTIVPKANSDLVYDTYLLALQSHLELWLGIIAASFPALAPLMNSVLKIKPNNISKSGYT